MGVVEESLSNRDIPEDRSKKTNLPVSALSSPDDNARLALSEYERSDPLAVSTPPELCLDLTNDCALRCMHCSRSYAPRRLFSRREKPRHLSRKAMARIPDRYYRQARQIDLSGIGEPMRHPEWDEVIVWMSKKSSGQITFNTSLSRTTEARLGRLAEIGAGVSVSIDGARKETYQRIRRGASHRVVFDSLERLSQLGRDAGHPRFFLRVKWTLMKPNLKELPEFVDIAADMGIKEIHVQALAPHHPSLNDWCCTVEDPDTETYLVRALERATVRGVALTIPRHLLFTPALQSGMSRNAEASRLQADTLWHHHWPDATGCSYPWTQLRMDSDANVLACCFSNRIIGNILEEDLEQIWNNSHMATLRREVNRDRCSTYCVDSPSGGVCCPRIQWLKRQVGRTHFLQK